MSYKQGKGYGLPSLKQFFKSVYP